MAGNAEISNFYSQYLGRDGSKDAKGKAYWQNELSSGKMTLDQIGQSIASSNEAQKYKSSGLPSAPQAPAGHSSVAAQQQRYDRGQKLATDYQESGFKPAASYEGRNTNESFVDAVYQNETGRDADQNGRDYWLNQMAGGMTRDQVIESFNRSKEGMGYDSPDQAEQEVRPPSLQPAAQATLPQANTMAGLLDSILAKDSPLMQRAATQGKQFASNRGLLNSSMAGGAAQGAMIDRATPIASQDSQSALSLSQFNAGQTNDMRRQSNDFSIRSNLMEQGQGYDLQKMQSQFGYTSQLAEQGQGYDLQKMQSQFGYTSQLAEQGQGYDLQKMQSQFGYTSQLATQEAEQALSKLYASSNANAWGVMANNVTDLVGQASAQIQNIQMNPDIEQADKAALIQQVLSNRDTDIAFQGALYQNLASDLLSTGLFPDSTGTTSVSNAIVTAFRRAGQTPDSGTVEQWRTAIESGQATMADLEAQLLQQTTA